MKPLKFVVLLLLSLGLVLTSCKEKSKPRLLVFSKTGGFRHESILAGKLALLKLGKENNIVVDTTEDAGQFTEGNLKKYAAVVFLNTTGNNILDFRQKACLERFIQAGGGFVGVHAATDTEYEWPWYAKMVGANFESHPDQQQAKIDISNPNHPATKDLPATWERKDEWYNLKNLNKKVTVLAYLDEKSYKGGNMGDKHPIAWYHEYDGGRAFYTALGHTNESYKEPLFLKHLLGGIQYAIGDNVLDYSKAHTVAVPEANRFVQKVLVAGPLNEPMELAITPDNKVFYIERRGGMFVYEPDSGKARRVAHIPVFSGLEDGLLGIALDPNYQYNHQLYLFYSPVGDTPQQYVSRFTYRNNMLDMASEKIMLTITTQREKCCHSAGSLAFGGDGNLFIAVGDNSNPHESSGMAPIDDRPNREPFDAQRTAANTNDLRGKILRIHPEADGTYSIPEGNLFAKDGSQGRPEIYVMGCRNPYRITYDIKNKRLFWGDVGPDSGEDLPQGHAANDEFNMATKPGFYGWPYFNGNNKPYKQFNFATGEVGVAFDATHPVNNSANNTGQSQLPPAQKAFIWYSYKNSLEFPLVGFGGRSAMAGPVYHFNKNKKSPNAFPAYFDNMFFAYEWMRDWVMPVRLDNAGKYISMEPVFENIKLSHPIDMQFASDGTLYILEYGMNWFKENKEAQLSQILYHPENRPPVAVAEVAKTLSLKPLKIQFSGAKSYDYDADDLIYEWKFEGKKIQSREKNPVYTFEHAGIFKTELLVTDTKGNKNTAALEVVVGNTAPQITIDFDGNSHYYWDNAAVGYNIKVKDNEDAKIDRSKIKVFLDYLPEGNDMAAITLGHQAPPSNEIDNALIKSSDCKACHTLNEKSIGPDFKLLAKTYAGQVGIAEKLADKILKGGTGVWGDHAMSAHPQLSKETALKMVAYILSLNEENKTLTLPAAGTIHFDKHIGKKEKGKYFITATYQDQAVNGVPALTGRVQQEFTDASLKADIYTETQNFKKWIQDGIIEPIETKGYFKLPKIDLNKIVAVELLYSGTCNSQITIRKSSPTGSVLATQPLPATGAWDKWQSIKLPIAPTSTVEDLYFGYEMRSEKILKNEFQVKRVVLWK